MKGWKGGGIRMKGCGLRVLSEIDLEWFHD